MFSGTAAQCKLEVPHLLTCQLDDALQLPLWAVFLKKGGQPRGPTFYNSRLVFSDCSPNGEGLAPFSDMLPGGTGSPSPGLLDVDWTGYYTRTLRDGQLPPNLN